MNTIGNLSHSSKSLEPVKEIPLQEAVHLAIVAKLSAALLDMIGPVAAGVLNFRKKILLNPTFLSFDYKHVGSIHTTDILLE
jgi:hypothetical protein